MPSLSNQKLYENLLDLDLIPESILTKLYERTKENKLDLYQAIVDEALLSDENLGKVISEILELPFVDLTDVAIPKDVLLTLPREFVRTYHIVAFRKDKQGIHLATSQPNHELALDLVKRTVKEKVNLHFATRSGVSSCLFLYEDNIESFFKDLIKRNIEKAKVTKTEQEPPIITIVDSIIGYATKQKTSDIHIEPGEKFALIRFRIDGILHDIVSIPAELHPRIVTRIKVLAKLRTDEHQTAQDGKIQFKIPDKFTGYNQKIDLRVSVVPSTDGEKIVMRLLAEHGRQLTLEDLGFRDTDLTKIKKAYKKPYGMILATGPTGSGKTTTMYTILKLLNSREVNISTIEDPVEYNIDGVTQIQVNTKTDLTFAKGLRSIVRQDPDIVLVGEIRDPETASIATNAAMTGHLVLSTLHTNDSATAIPRLIDMDIEPFLIASTINVIVAQRLVRKIHMKCRASHEIQREELSGTFDEKTLDKMFGKSKKIRAYKGEGCDACNHTGYEGRVGIYEVLIVNDAIRKSIVAEDDASQIHKIATQQGMSTMMEDGMEKIKQGITTVEEVIRVTKESE